jgi:hypothetical protein
MLKLNIGFTRKVGEANYGSRGASVNLEVDVESGLVREPDKLQAKIDYLFGLAKKSVDARLDGNGYSEPTPAANTPNRNGNGVRDGNGHSNGNGNANSNGSHAAAGSNGNGNGNGNGSHRASEKQMTFVNQLARGIRGLGVRRLETLTGKMFGKPLADLSSLNASSLIDTLKAIKEGRVSLDAALSNGEPA